MRWFDLESMHRLGTQPIHASECLRCYVIGSLPARRRNTGLFAKAFPKDDTDERYFARGKGSQPFHIQGRSSADKGEKQCQKKTPREISSQLGEPISEKGTSNENLCR